jgi:tellurite resistance protein
MAAAESHPTEENVSQEQPTEQAWTPEHDLALIFIALAYGTDAEFTDHEIEHVTEALSRWRPDEPQENVREVVVEALAMFEHDSTGDEVVRAIETLASRLDAPSRERALEDVMRIAEADGLLLSGERSLISVIAAAWDLRGAETDLLARSSAAVDERPVWSLLHDIALLAIAVAHGSTGTLTGGELDRMVDRLRSWRMDLDDDDVRGILRAAIAAYRDGDLKDEIQRSARSIKERLPHAMRLIVIDDIIAVAEADGPMNAAERDMIGSLAQAWHVGVRFEA